MPKVASHRLQRYGAVGDVLMAEPLLRELTRRGERVTFVTSRAGAEVLANFPSPLLRISLNKNPFVRAAAKLTRRVKKLKYERLPLLHVQAAYARIAGVEGFEPAAPRLSQSDAERRSPLPGDYAVLHLQRNAKHLHRNAYDVDWRAVIAHLERLGLRAVQVGLAPEPGCGEHHPTPSLRELMRTIQGARLFIGLDSAPGHFAVSLGRPSVLFFGAVDPRLRLVEPERVEVLQAPCELAGCYHRFVRRKDQKVVRCVRLDADGLPPCCRHSTGAVIEAAERALARGGHA